MIISTLTAANLPPASPQTQAKAVHSAATSVAQLLAAHFRALGGRTFWQQAAESIRIRQQGMRAQVSVTQPGVALRRYGGIVLPGRNTSPITGKPTRLLALPADRKTTFSPAASGLLQFIPIAGKPRLKGLLLPGEKAIAARNTPRHRKGETITRAAKGASPLFHLVTQTTHQPNPAILPTPEQIHTTATAAANNAIRQSLPTP